LALAVVGLFCIPLSQGLSADENTANPWANWDSDRWSRLLIGPEQIACYCCFLWAGLIVLSRYLELRRQRRALALRLLPTGEGVRILHEDPRPLLRRLEQLTARSGPLILGNMIRLALGKYAVSRSSRDISETVRDQAEISLSRLV